VANVSNDTSRSPALNLISTLNIADPPDSDLGEIPHSKAVDLQRQPRSRLIKPIHQSKHPHSGGFSFSEPLAGFSRILGSVELWSATGSMSVMGILRQPAGGGGGGGMMLEAGSRNVEAKPVY
jgi:hypothetical protein